MAINDALHTDLTNVQPVKDSVFVPEYVQKNPLEMSSNKQNVSCRQYIFTLIKDSELKQQERPTMFKEKTYCPKDMKMELNTYQSPSNWIFGIFIFIVFSLVMFLRFAGAQMWSFLAGCFSKNQIAITTKDGTTTHALVFLPIVFILFPTITFLLFGIIDYYDLCKYALGYSNALDLIIKTPILLWLGIYLGFAIIYFFKILLIKFFAWVFKERKISNYYVQIVLNFGFLAGILLILPSFFVMYGDRFYTEICFFVMGILLGLLFVTRLLRCFFVIIDTFRFSHIYLFFYLCILELLPLIVVGKILFF